MGFALIRKDGALVGPFVSEEYARSVAHEGDEVRSLIHPWDHVAPDRVVFIEAHLEAAMWELLGRTFGQAQALESAMLVLRQISGLIDGDDSLEGEDLWQYLEGNRQTMGKKLGALKANVELPSQLRTLLRQAVRKRDDLAHHFLSGRRGLRIANNAGAHAAMEELHAAHDLMERATAACFSFLVSAVAAAGAAGETWEEDPSPMLATLVERIAAGEAFDAILRDALGDVAPL